MDLHALFLFCFYRSPYPSTERDSSDHTHQCTVTMAMQVLEGKQNNWVGKWYEMNLWVTNLECFQMLFLIKFYHGQYAHFLKVCLNSGKKNMPWAHGHFTVSFLCRFSKDIFTTTIESKMRKNCSKSQIKQEKLSND